MSYKVYISIISFFFFIFVPVVFYISNVLYERDETYTTTDALRKYQFEKISNSENVELIIVGDSSAGNAINADALDELTNLSVLNLALTGRFGLTGDYNLIRHAKEKNDTLKYVVIMHTLDIWDRNWSEEGYISTLGDLSQVSFEGIAGDRQRFDLIKYKINPKEIAWFLEFKYKGGGDIEEIENDYVKQGEAKFSNGEKVLSGEAISIFVQERKLLMLRELDELCVDLELNCVFMHGPIHSGVLENSTDSIRNINESLPNDLEMAVVREIFDYPNELMGNTIDHVTPAIKDDVTEDYFEVLVKEGVFN